MSNSAAASSAVGFEAPPWLMVGPPLCLVISSAPFRRHEAAFAFLPAGRSSVREHSGGDLGDVAALEAGGVELVLARLAGAVAAGDGRRAIGAAAGDLVEPHLPLEGVRQAHRHHAEV